MKPRTRAPRQAALGALSGNSLSRYSSSFTASATISFEAAQNAWTRAKKVRDESYVAMTAARKRLRRVVANVGRVQEGYYRLAGLDDLADRLRLTIRGPRSKKPETGPGDPSSPPADAPDSPPVPPADEP